jgi:hypothetical protein
MSDVVKNILECRKIVEREINRPLTQVEQNIVRISFLNGQNVVYNDIVQRTGEIELEVEQSKAEEKKRDAKIKALQEQLANRPKLIIEHGADEVVIRFDQDDYLEVVKWVKDEWEEDPTLVNVICDAVIMAQVQPEQLIKIHEKHIESQRQINES